MNRRQLLKGALACATLTVPSLPRTAFAGTPIARASAGDLMVQASPDAVIIERKLGVAPQIKIAPKARVSVRQLKRDPHLRHLAPSIDIQSINFAFGSAQISQGQYWKVEQIAIAMNRILRRNRYELFLIEGHTDAVGSWQSNLALSEARARSLAYALTNYFGVPSRALDTIGYGEQYLLVQTQAPEWHNRRVTLRRITDFVLR